MGMSSKKPDFWENWYPTIIGSLLAVVAIILYECKYASFQRETLLNTVLTVNAIVVGAIYTNKSILFSIQNTRAVRHLREVGLYSLFLEYTFRAINCAALSTAVSVVLLVVKPESIAPVYLFIKYMWVWITAISLLTLYRANDTLTSMLLYNDGK